MIHILCPRCINAVFSQTLFTEWFGSLEQGHINDLFELEACLYVCL